MEIWGIAAKARSRSAKEEGVLLWERGNFCGSKNFFFSSLSSSVSMNHQPALLRLLRFTTTLGKEEVVRKRGG
ncbi:hypothetical protein QG37_08153 [Candidozyma auris]|nr:hypothetical protein QG37_08153 [[Candida] auris]